MEIITMTDYTKFSDQELIDALNKQKKIQVIWGSKEQAVKILLNSLYGALGNRHFRWYERKYAEAITLSGQTLWGFVEVRTNEYLNKILGTKDRDYVIAGDTDSCYIDFTPFLEKFGSEKETLEEKVDFLVKVVDGKFQEVIDRACEDYGKLVNVFDNKLSMKRESVASAIFLKKKKYAMRVYDSEKVRYTEPKPKVVGHEAVRSSTPAWCREEMKKVFGMIFQGERTKVIEYMEDVKKRFFELDLVSIGENISISDIESVAIGEGFKSGATRQGKAAVRYNQFLDKHNLSRLYPKIKNGDKIKMIIMKVPNTMNTPCLAFLSEVPPEFEIDKYIDKEEQFNKTFFEPMKRVFEVIGWKYNNEVSLEDFF
jgi:DNA polymerase elongation subunit (family B)